VQWLADFARHVRLGKPFLPEVRLYLDPDLVGEEASHAEWEAYRQSLSPRERAWTQETPWVATEPHQDH